MHANTVRDQITNFIMKQFPMARSRHINDTDRLLENGILDSLGVLEIVSYVEEEFHITVTDEELLPENFQSIECLVSFVHRKRNGVPTHQAEE